MENDKLIRQFLNESKKEIPNGNFSAKVLTNLPDTDLHWVVYLFASIGFGLTIYIAYQLNLFQVILSTLVAIPFYYILAAIILFPFVVMTCIFKNRIGFSL